MAIMNYKPTTAARRNMSVTDYTSLFKNGPEKSLLAPLDKKAGPQQLRPESPFATAAAATEKVPYHRLQAPEARHGSHRAEHRVRSQPFRFYRPGSV